MQELDYAKIGKRIRRIRERKGWSQEELARRCGVSLSFVGLIERGTRSMSLDTFAGMCRELETNADTLLFGTAQPLEMEIRSMWGEAEQKDGDNYKMYIRIMKSVADIMKNGDGFY